VLRRQCLRPWRKPLIIMSPKSLLRFRPCFSPASELTEGRFHRVFDDATADPTKVKRILMCSGKVYYDLDAARQERERDDVAIIRVEQLYPWYRTKAELEAALARYEKAQDLLWVQEEPHNMGPWSYIAPRLRQLEGSDFEPRYVGRERSASPATGSKDAHKLELGMILNEAFS
jgi:2-oxoglutarate dehydrogenase E1 component